VYSLFVKYYEEYLSNQGLSEKSIEVYIVDVLQFCLCPQVVDMMEGRCRSHEALQGFYRVLSVEYQPKSLQRKMVSVKNFLRYLFESGEIEEDSYRNFKFKVPQSKILPKFIPKSDLRAIFQFLSDDLAKSDSRELYRKKIRQGSVIEFLYLTGVRVEELCLLTPEDVLADEGVVLINGKGGRQRIVPVDIANTNFLSLYHNEFLKLSAAAKRYFVNNWGNALSTQSVRSLVRDVSQRAGVEINVTPHMFRHTLATNLLENEVDLRVVQEVLGHSTVKTTEIYTHVAISHVKKELQRKHPYKFDVKS